MLYPLMVYDAGGPATTSLFVHGKMWLPLRVQEEKESKKIQKETRSRNQKVKSQERLKDVISTASLSTSTLVLAAIHKLARHFD